MTPATAVAFALLVAGVLGSLHAWFPGGVLSLAGVYLYWWDSAYAAPDRFTLALLTGVGLVAVASRAFERVVTERVGGVSTLTATVAAGVGFALFPFLGTTGLLVGLVTTAFVLEYVRRRDVKGSLLAAVAVVFESFASTLFQILLTGAMLAVMVLVVYL
jgi:uncharacterized protein YqgC (DUF456 family)